MILHHEGLSLRYKPALEPIASAMLNAGWDPEQVNHASNLALESAQVYDLMILWLASSDVERDHYGWMIGDAIEDHLAIWGRIPSLQWLRGITSHTPRDPATQS